LEEAERRSHEIYELKAAAARLDGAKLLLQEKHTVIDGLYEKAENALNALNKEDTLALYSRLLETYAEEGDTVYLSENCVVSEELRHIDAVTKKKLVIAKERLAIRGGMILKGTTSDKDLSFAALLHEDREEYAAQIAGELFKDHV
jgi:vacuolar-type H+-ATPase subunit E/Vma4